VVLADILQATAAACHPEVAAAALKVLEALAEIQHLHLHQKMAQQVRHLLAALERAVHPPIVAVVAVVLDIMVAVVADMLVI
jgi:hypothetical protein